MFARWQLETVFRLFSRAESGFNHVEDEKYEPRLLHFKGKKVRNIGSVIIVMIGI